MVSKTKALEGWFDGDLGAYAVGCLDGARVETEESVRGGHASRVAAGRERRFGLHWFLGRRGHCAAAAWECPEQHAVYAVEVYGEGAAVRATADDFAVVCCGGGGVR